MTMKQITIEVSDDLYERLVRNVHCYREQMIVPPNYMIEQMIVELLDGEIAPMEFPGT